MSYHLSTRDVHKKMWLKDTRWSCERINFLSLFSSPSLSKLRSTTFFALTLELRLLNHHYFPPPFSLPYYQFLNERLLTAQTVEQVSQHKNVFNCFPVSNSIRSVSGKKQFLYESSSFTFQTFDSSFSSGFLFTFHIVFYVM